MLSTDIAEIEMRSLLRESLDREKEFLVQMLDPEITPEWFDATRMKYEYRLDNIDRRIAELD